MAHEMNNLLAVMQGGCDLLAPRLADAADAARLQRIAAAVARAALLTRAGATLDGLRREPGEAVELHGWLRRHQASLMARLAPHALRLDLAGPPCPVVLPPSALAPALHALLANAGEAMAAGDCAVLRCAHMVDGAGRPEVVLSLGDPGCGMSAETQAQARRAFFSTKPGHQGLGLTLVAGFMRRAGGRLAIESTEGVGSTLHLRFPA
jgi:signal transduction histidine kinase